MRCFLGISLLFTVMIGCVRKDCDIIVPPTNTDIILPTAKDNIEPTDEVVSISLKDATEVKDATITSYFPDTNYGNRGIMLGEAWTKDGDIFIERSYIDFDLSSIPSGVKIQSATLKFFADTLSYIAAVKGHYGTNDWELIKVISPWDESSITWNNIPEIDSTSKINLQGANTYYQAYDVDVTDFVKSQHSHNGSAFGFLLKLKEEKIYRLINFCSSDCPYPELRPELIVTYAK